MTIDSIVTMTDEQFAAVIDAARAAENAAYLRYCRRSSIPAAEPGSPQAAGHGSWSSELNAGGVQYDWYAAKATIEYLATARTRWVQQRTTRTSAVYLNTSMGHRIEIVTHGVNVAACDTPSAAIAAVRSSLAV